MTKSYLHLPLCKADQRQATTAMILATLTVSSIARAESFESLPAGPLEKAQTAIGSWSAAAGNAHIHRGNARTGHQSLRIVGQDERTAVLTLTEPASKGASISFHAERWTQRAPFQFRIDAKERGSWKEIKNADDLPTGKFKGEVRLELPAGTSELRFRVTAPADAGVIMDDFTFHRPGPARATLVEAVQPVCPAFIREDFNPVLGFRIVAGGADPSEDAGATIAEGKKVAGKITVTSKHELPSGEHWFWLSPTLKETASLDHRIDASLHRVKVG